MPTSPPSRWAPVSWSACHCDRAVSVPPGEVFHATTVAVDGKGVLILGPSGSGKSALALRLMALGARLVADDRTRVTCANGVLTAHAPPRLAGVIEARGVGLIRVPWLDSAPLRLAVDMGRVEPDRLPQPKSLTISGTALELLWRVDGPHFDSAIWHLIEGERFR